MKTITQSKGVIPLNFLRACGTPEDLIEYSRNLNQAGEAYCSCFISHSHADKLFAQRLYDLLQARGVRCWFDEHQMFPGDDIFEEVDRGIKLWDKVLLCCSEASMKSWWVDNEVLSVFDKERLLFEERRQKVLALIPLDLDGFIFSDRWQRGYKKQVLARLAADFTEWKVDNEKFRSEFEKLVRALRIDEGAREAPPEPKL